jgi:DNA mismatch repair protein MutS2
MLNDLITSLEKEKKMAEREREELIKLKAEAKKRLVLIKDKRDEYIGKVEERCNNRLLELELEIENIQKEVAKKERSSVAKSKKQLKSLRERFGSEIVKKQETLNIGDYVMVKTLGSKGRIVDIDKSGDTYEVIVGNARMKLKRFFVEKTLAEKESNGAVKSRIDVDKIDEPELNVMGMRVEEALNTLDRFLDRAVVEGIPRVKILHGIGTGRLMQAIRKHLTDGRYIKALQKDEKNSGVTIVEFA